MEVNVINPLTNEHWKDLVDRHPGATAFHARGWLESLALTYGYEPFALTTTREGEPLQNGVVLCRVKSWITGSRLVSLPFTDHCDPLLGNADESPIFQAWLETECKQQSYRYVELRPRSDGFGRNKNWRPSQFYWLHGLDLSPTLEQLFNRLHKNSVQRKIRRAEKEKLKCDTGRSEEHIGEFYRLLIKTRRRHQLLPQPKSWFRNLLKCNGGHAEIRLARKNGIAIAAIFTLKHRESVIYKYGCSDESYHQLGAMPFLFWDLIESGKNQGAREIDFGRCDMDQGGLVIFKDRFGAHKQMLIYHRYTENQTEQPPNYRNANFTRHLLPMLPNVALTAAGSFLYRHTG